MVWSVRGESECVGLGRGSACGWRNQSKHTKQLCGCRMPCTLRTAPSALACPALLCGQTPGFAYPVGRLAPLTL